MPRVRLSRDALVPWGLPAVCLLTGETEDVTFEKVPLVRRPWYSHPEVPVIGATVLAWDDLGGKVKVLAVFACILSVIAAAALTTHLEAHLPVGPVARRGLTTQRRLRRVAFVLAMIAVWSISASIGVYLIVFDVVSSAVEALPVGFRPRFRLAGDEEVDLDVPSESAAAALARHLAGEVDVALPPGAMCARHAGPATTVCLRCGDFACASCFEGASRLCSDCRARG